MRRFDDEFPTRHFRWFLEYLGIDGSVLLGGHGLLSRAVQRLGTCRGRVAAHCDRQLRERMPT